MTSNESNDVKYVYDLPYFERKKLCRTLDQNDKWEELGGNYMGFRMMDIQDLRLELRKGNSPTDELLTKWGHQNHTVVELFVLLSKMHHYQCMLILKPFVGPDLQHLIYEGGANFQCASGTHKMGAREVSVNSTSTDGAARQGGNFADKNMEFGDNLNVAQQDRGLPPLSKVMLPPVGEEKVVNTVAPGVQSSDRNETVRPDARRPSREADPCHVAESSGSIPHIDYRELVEATKNWDRSSILGRGGFGTVFKGTWRNTLVAIKRIEQRGAETAESGRAQLEQSLRELRILNMCRHDNILSIYGYSVRGDEPCLVYQFMPNGSLEDRLLCRQGSCPLSWSQRHNIAEGTARGLQFLHNNSTPFIHGDVKSANILLDKHMCPRLGDFGLAREGPQSQYTHMKVSRVHGTRPYLPDEFLRARQLSPRVDTYSFGVVLFEIATGLRAYDDHRSVKFLKELVDGCEDAQLPSLRDTRAGPDDGGMFLSLVALGRSCVRRRPRERPDMETVLRQLEGLRTAHPTRCLSLAIPQQGGHSHDPTARLSPHLGKGLPPFQMCGPPQGVPATHHSPTPATVFPEQFVRGQFPPTPARVPADQAPPQNQSPGRHYGVIQGQIPHGMQHSPMQGRLPSNQSPTILYGANPHDQMAQAPVHYPQGGFVPNRMPSPSPPGAYHAPIFRTLSPANLGQVPAPANQSPGSYHSPVQCNVSPNNRNQSIHSPGVYPLHVFCAASPTIPDQMPAPANNQSSAVYHSPIQHTVNPAPSGNGPPVVSQAAGAYQFVNQHAPSPAIPSSLPLTMPASLRQHGTFPENVAPMSPEIAVSPPTGSQAPSLLNNRDHFVPETVADQFSIPEEQQPEQVSENTVSVLLPLISELGFKASEPEREPAASTARTGTHETYTSSSVSSCSSNESDPCTTASGKTHWLLEISS